MAEGGDGSSRNFRSAYYGKLGFCGNDEKNILDMLIASSPFDLEELNDLCERFDLDRRCVEAWKIILGVECSRKNTFDEYANVKRVRAEHFQSLKHHVEVLLRHDAVIRQKLKRSSTTKLEPTKPLDDQYQLQEENCYLLGQKSEEGEEKCYKEKQDVLICERNCAINNDYLDSPASDRSVNQSSENEPALCPEKRSPHHNSMDNLLEEIEANPGRLITLMFLLEAGRLEPSDIIAQLDSTHCRKMSAMALFFVNVSSDLQEAFFLFRNFTRKIEENQTRQETTKSK